MNILLSICLIEITIGIIVIVWFHSHYDWWKSMAWTCWRHCIAPIFAFQLIYHLSISLKYNLWRVFNFLVLTFQIQITIHFIFIINNNIFLMAFNTTI